MRQSRSDSSSSSERRISTLTPENMIKYARSLGVNYDPARNALNEEDAEDNFINLLPVTSSFKVSFTLSYDQ